MKLTLFGHTVVLSIIHHRPPSRADQACRKALITYMAEYPHLNFRRAYEGASKQYPELWAKMRAEPDRSGYVRVMCGASERALANHIGQLLTKNVRQGSGSVKRPPAIWFGFPPPAEKPKPE